MFAVVSDILRADFQGDDGDGVMDVLSSLGHYLWSK